MKYDKAIDLIARQLRPGETILASSEAALNDPATNNGQFGAIALTEGRLLFVGDMLRFNRADISLPLSSINSVQRRAQMGFNVTRVTTHSVSYDFVKLTDPFKAQLEAARAAATTPSPSPPPGLPAQAGTVSVADEIAKLLSLRQSGALTDTEFEQAKSRLLST